MSETIRRNWRQLSGATLDDQPDSATLFVNRHTGVSIKVWHDQRGDHLTYKGTGWVVCLPSGRMCRHYETEQQAMSFARNWVRDHPAGGVTALETVDDPDADWMEPLKSPLESSRIRDLRDETATYLAEQGGRQ